MRRDVILDFTKDMISKGFNPPTTIAPDGKIRRFSTNGKPQDKAGYCALFDDGIPAGYYGCWRTGEYYTWCADIAENLSHEEKAISQAKKDAIRLKRETEEKERHAQACVKADKIWKKATKAPNDHPYLVQKGINAHGIRIYRGLLVIPMRYDGKLHSLQFIGPTGEKRFLKGGRISGCYFSIGKPDKDLDVCEGISTGSSCHEATGHAVAIAFNAANIVPVAKYLRNKFPNIQLRICADDDVAVKGNPGLTKAIEAALAVKGLLAVPNFGESRPHGMTDFNDLASYQSLAAVKSCIENASDPSGELPKLDAISNTNNDEWPELVSLNDHKLPQLNLANLPSWVGEYAKALSAFNETPPELAAGMLLVTCATAAARRLKVMVKPGYFEPCNLWIVAALPPGNRKSAIQSAATEPLIVWEREQSEILNQEIKRIASERKTMEARIKEIRTKAAKVKEPNDAKLLSKEAADLEEDLPNIPIPPQLWTSDATPERLGVLLADHGERMAWLSSEGGIFDLLQGRYSNGIPNLDLYLKSHSGDSERVDRTGRPPVFLLNPLLSVGLSPQPDVLRGLTSKPGFRGRGLLGRFQYFLPSSPLGSRTLKGLPVSDTLTNAYAAGIKAMLNWEPAINENGDQIPYILQLSSEAYSEWFLFAQTIEMMMLPGGDLEQFTDWAGKAPGAVARLAGVLHGILHAHGKPWDVNISAETMTCALNIMAVMMRHSLAALDIMGADPSIALARQVWDWIERRRLPSFTIREAFNALRSIFPRVKNIRDVINVLEERGYVVVIETISIGPGRPPSPTVRVRSQILEGWK